MPSEICREIGYSLHLAQIEVEDEDSKPMRGFRSADVREITKMDENGTYRAVYTVKFEEIVYVLHVFQKKSKKGIETPKKEIDLIKSRLKDAQQLYKSWKEENEEKAK